MKVIVCLEPPDVDVRFAKVCELPIEPFLGLVVRAHVGGDVWHVKIDDITVSTANKEYLIAYCNFDDEPGAHPETTVKALRKDRSWRQFGSYEPEDENIPDGPNEKDCLEMLAEA